MPHLHRRTTVMLAILLGVSQAGAAFAFVWYQLGAIDAATFPREGLLVPDPRRVSYSVAWARVYVSSLIAWGVLSFFAARGLKLWCLITAATLTALSLPIAVLAGAQVGA